MSRGDLLAMAGLCALRWSLHALVVAEKEDTQLKLQVRHLPHGIQLPTAPYPARRNFEFVHRYPDRPKGSSTYTPRAGNVQLFGDPLPGDNFSLTTVPEPPRMPSRPELVPQQTRGFRPYQMPNYDLPLLDEPLVTRLALGPPPPSVDLSHLAELSGIRVGSFRTGRPAHGFLPPGPKWQVGQGFGPPRVRGSYGGMNPWSDLTIPTAMGPYDRRLNLRPVSPPQLPLRDIDDPSESSTKISLRDSLLDAEDGALVPPPEPEQLAPLAPPPMSPRNVSRLPQSDNVNKLEYPIMNMLRNFSRFHELLEDQDRDETSTRWRYQYSREPAPTTPRPGLLSGEGGMMNAPAQESNDASLFSDAERTAKPRPPLLFNTLDYILL